MVDDIWIAMAVGLLACLGLAALHARTQYAGYAVLVVLGVTTLPVLAVTAARSDHPARWGATLAVAALVVIGTALAPTLLARRQPARQSGHQRPQ